MTAPPAWLETNDLEPWMDELLTCTHATGQFVLTENVHDLCFVPGATSLIKHNSVVDGVTALLKAEGYEYVLAWDRVSGLYLVSNEADDPVLAHVQDVLGLRRLSTECGTSILDAAELHQVLEPIVDDQRRGALIIDYASRLVATESEPHLGDDMLRLFVVAEKLSRETNPRAGRPYNPIIWLVDKDRDLPAWFVNNNSGVRVITIPSPDRPMRSFAAHKYWLRELEITSAPDQLAAARTFAKHTAGMPFTAMQDIWRLARSQRSEQLAGTDLIEQAARSYRVGVSRNPWADPDLRTKIAEAEDAIAHGVGESGTRVFGQDHAVRKAVDVMMRSSLGLSSAQAQGGGKPRGVLFLAGPTGVGKTQLAKALNQIVFDAEEPIRFDMSEFSSEHAEARLVGSPPGYVGHGSGGELTNAIRQRPFSVVLFDELEKAHYKIFDKFLQILDDGRLTDGSGQTVHFSEAIIVFTTNWGMIRERSRRNDQGEEIVERTKRSRSDYLDGSGGTDYERFSTDVTDAIVEGFERMGRPELLNRIGHDNIIVFDFINREAAQQIFEDAYQSVRQRVRSSVGVEIELSTEAKTAIWEFAWERCAELEMGGRGIGAAVETALVNPLSRLLYEVEPADGATLDIVAAWPEEQSGRWQLEAR